MKAQTILFTGVNQVALGTAQIPDPGPGEVLLESLYSCVSPGTELRCLAGKQAGSETMPFIPGYANVARVVARGDGVSLAEGTIVLGGGTSKADLRLIWGAHVSHGVKSAGGLIVLPKGIDLVQAAVAHLMAISYHGLQLSNPRPEETVACVGLGPIGMLSAMLHTLTGAKVVGFDLFEERVALARTLGVEAVQVKGDVVETAKTVFPDGADIVVDSTGVPSVLRNSARIGKVPAWSVTHRDLPRLVLQGSYPADFALDYHDIFSRAYKILVPRDKTPQDLAAAVGLVARKKVNLRPFSGDPVSPQQAPEMYRILREQPQKRMTAVFEWKKA